MALKTVWVVEQGEYSDYRVVGVFSVKASAQQLADLLNAPPDHQWEKATIAEWPLDPATDELRAGYEPHRVQMQRDGTVDMCEPVSINAEYLLGNIELRRFGQANPIVLDALVWAKDEQHAIKIANEHRTQMIANGQWAPDPVEA